MESNTSQINSNIDRLDFLNMYLLIFDGKKKFTFKYIRNSNLQ